MSARHTPGPWQWNETRHFLRAAEPDPDTSSVHTILDVGYGYTGYLGSERDATRAEGEANFDLIEAAPLLLESLRELAELAVLQFGMPPQGADGPLQKALAAIAKADGDTTWTA